MSPIVCIRDDDISFFTSMNVLKRIRELVWKDRVVSYGLVPYASSNSFRRKLPIRAIRIGSIDYRENVALEKYLRAMLMKRVAEIALHGLTHDDFSSGTTISAEFETEREGDSERVLAELRRLNHEMGCNVFIPPHNVVHRKIELACLDSGFHVCRSLTDKEVDESFLKDGKRIDRHTAKKRIPYKKHRIAMTLFQTLMLSKRKILREKKPVVKLLDPFVDIAIETGIAILTVHWWDFLADENTRLDSFFVEYVNEFLKSLESRCTTQYLGLSGAAKHLMLH